MEHFFEIVAEFLFGFSNTNPDKIPEDIIYNPNFIVKHATKKFTTRMLATSISTVVFLLLGITVKDDTRILFIAFVVLSFILLLLFLFLFSFQCSVSQEGLKCSYLWGLFGKYFEWKNVRCVRIIEQTDEKSIIVAIYNKDGKCVLDLNADMDNVWYVVKMAEVKNIIVKYEKDLSIKQISHL